MIKTYNASEPSTATATGIIVATRTKQREGHYETTAEWQGGPIARVSGDMLRMLHRDGEAFVIGGLRLLVVGEEAGADVFLVQKA